MRTQVIKRMLFLTSVAAFTCIKFSHIYYTKGLSEGTICTHFTVYDDQDKSGMDAEFFVVKPQL